MMEKIRFDDFIKLNRGFDLPDSQIVMGEYPVVASTNIKAYHNAYKVEGPQVITGRSGSLGKVQYIEDKCWPLNTSLYVKDFKGNFPKYVYYFLQTMHLEQFNAGAGVPTLNQNHLHSLKILVHQKDAQRKIASILSSYDSLIENNTKRIRLLEQMAENLYKEWFVRFRFPGHENTEFVDGLPKGWEKDKLESICKFERGKNITSGEMKEGNIPVIAAGVAPSGFHNQANVHGTSITMSSSGANAGFIAIHYGDIWAADCSYISETSTKNIFYIYQLLDNLRVVITNMQRGAAQPHVYAKDINNLKICIPSKELRKAANDRLSAIHKQIYYLQQQSALLTRQRDLLLPRLMSGKLEVKAIKERPSK